MSGHLWNSDDRCTLCGDRDWYADRYCSGNPKVKSEYNEWIAEQKKISSDDKCDSVKIGVST